MNEMRKLMEAVSDTIGSVSGRPDPDDQLRTQLSMLIEVAAERGWDEAAEYIQHVLDEDYDSLETYDDSLEEDSGEVDTKIDTWFERDRAYVGLDNAETDETIIEWWDEDVHQAVEDGFLDPSDWHGSAVEYAKHLGVL